MLIKETLGLRQRLLENESKFIEDITLADQLEIPEIDYSLILPEVRQDVEKLINILIRFLYSHSIKTKKFRTKYQRDSWRARVRRDYEGFDELNDNNDLRGSPYAGIKYGLSSCFNGDDYTKYYLGQNRIQFRKHIEHIKTLCNQGSRVNIQLEELGKCSKELKTEIIDLLYLLEKK